MAKFKISQNPTFKVDVPIPQVGAKPVMVPFTFKYRDRTAMAALYDEWSARAEALNERFKGTEPSISEVTAAEIENSSLQVKDLVVAWGFDDKLNDESIAALVGSCMGVSDAIVDAYGGAYAQARLGN